MAIIAIAGKSGMEAGSQSPTLRKRGELATGEGLNMSARNQGDDLELTDHDAAGLVIAAANAAKVSCPDRINMRQGKSTGGADVIIIVLNGFRVENGAVIDLVANGGKPEVKDGGK